MGDRAYSEGKEEVLGTTPFGRAVRRARARATFGLAGRGVA